MALRSFYGRPPIYHTDFPDGSARDSYVYSASDIGRVVKVSSTYFLVRAVDESGVATFAELGTAATPEIDLLQSNNGTFTFAFPFTWQSVCSLEIDLIGWTVHVTAVAQTQAPDSTALNEFQLLRNGSQIGYAAQPLTDGPVNVTLGAVVTLDAESNVFDLQWQVQAGGAGSNRMLQSVILAVMKAP